MLDDFDVPHAPWWYDPLWDWHPTDRSQRQRRWIWNYDDIHEPAGSTPGADDPTPQAAPATHLAN